MHGLEIMLNMKVQMLMIALLINWEFVIAVAHFNRDDAKIDTNRVNVSLQKAQQSPADVERLYLRTAGAREDDCELYLKKAMPSIESAEDSMTESTFKCRACLSDHSWGNADSNRNGPIPTQNDEFKELLRGPVTWRSLKSHQWDFDGVAMSDVNQPVFHCGNELLMIKFSRTLHSNPHLVISNETKWTDSPSQKQCQCIKRNHGPSMLLGIPFKECFAQNWTQGKRMLYSVRVLYFDHLLMRTFSGTATCHSTILPHDVPSTGESPKVICGKAYVIVKLLAKTIKNVKVLDVSRQLSRPVLWKSHHIVYVKVKRSAIEGGFLQLDYLDVNGKSQTITVSCVHHTFPFKKAIRKRRQDPFDFISEYDPIPTVPFKPDWAAIASPLQTIMPTGISAHSESSSTSIVTTRPFDIAPDARVAEGLDLDLLEGRVNPTVSFEPLEQTLGTAPKTPPCTNRQPSRITKTGTAVDANVECATDFGLLDFVLPSVPFWEYEESPKMTRRKLPSSTPTHPDPTTRTNTVPFRLPEITLGTNQKEEHLPADTQPRRITETVTANVDVECATDFGLLESVIPSVPLGEFEETPKVTQGTLASRTTTHLDLTTRTNTVPFIQSEMTLDTTQKAETSGGASQPSKIIKTQTAADVECATDFGHLDSVIPTVPFGEFEESPKMTQWTLPSNTLTHPDHVTFATRKKEEVTAISCNASDEFNFHRGFSDIPLGPYRPVTTTAAKYANLESTPVSRAITLPTTEGSLEISTAGETISPSTNPPDSLFKRTTSVSSTAVLLEKFTSVITASAVTEHGLTSAVKTTMAQTTTYTESSTLGSTSPETTTLGTTVTTPSVSSTAIVLETSTPVMTTAMKTTSVVATPDLTSAVESTTLAQTTTSESTTLGSTSPESTSLRTTSTETTPSVTSLGTTLAETTPSVSSTGIVLETSTPVMTTTMKTTSDVTTPGLTSAVESTTLAQTTSSESTTLGRTSPETTTLGTTKVLPKD
ncbi:uncharacterized protein LOC143714533 [Siphateles boraxobius]|uniref:uncharacterized protein LOC143714533 n=1 Tax=Siphateles boraxobius TaxID=180520 RepID=UPI00406442CF